MNTPEWFGGFFIIAAGLHFIISFLPARELYDHRFETSHAVGATANAVEKLADRDVYPAHWLIGGILCMILGKLTCLLDEYKGFIRYTLERDAKARDTSWSNPLSDSPATAPPIARPPPRR